MYSVAWTFHTSSTKFKLTIWWKESTIFFSRYYIYIFIYIYIYTRTARNERFTWTTPCTVQYAVHKDLLRVSLVGIIFLKFVSFLSKTATNMMAIMTRPMKLKSSSWAFNYSEDSIMSQWYIYGTHLLYGPNAWCEFLNLGSTEKEIMTVYQIRHHISAPRLKSLSNYHGALSPILPDAIIWEGSFVPVCTRIFETWLTSMPWSIYNALWTIMCKSWPWSPRDLPGGPSQVVC